MGGRAKRQHMSLCIMYKHIHDSTTRLSHSPETGCVSAGLAPAASVPGMSMSQEKNSFQLNKYIYIFICPGNSV